MKDWPEVLLVRACKQKGEVRHLPTCEHGSLLLALLQKQSFRGIDLERIRHLGFTVNVKYTDPSSGKECITPGCNVGL